MARAKFCTLEPLGRKLGLAVGHIFSPEYANRKHLLRGEIRPKFGVEILALGLRPLVTIPLLHFVIYDYDGLLEFRFHVRISSWLSAESNSLKSRITR